MPIATPDVYAEMLDAAKNGRFAYPAINVSSSQTLNAALQGFAEAGSDGIVQVSTGGAEYATRSTSRCTPTTARRTSWTVSSGRCWRCPPSG
jgi:fructose-bisphosphate aldolase class II